MRILDAFCGIGWGQALDELGMTEVGIDFDADVCATRALHGWETVHADITTLDPLDFPCEVGIFSPPCQDFSNAGRKAMLDGDRGKLVWQVEKWALALRPRVVVCEQVPAVLPIWKLIGSRLAAEGYSWWAGDLSAEQYGVPQTRKRAILIARRDGLSPLPPAPTHNPYRKGVAADAGPLKPWVSMADALGMRGAAGFPRRTRDGQDEDDGEGYRARDWHDMDNPAATATEKWRSWVLRERQAHGATRQAERDSPPGPRPEADGFSGQYGPDPIKLTIEQGLILQSFTPDFALAGSKTSQWRQIGNAVAPRFAKALLGHVLGVCESGNDLAMVNA